MRILGTSFGSSTIPYLLLKYAAISSAIVAWSAAIYISPPGLTKLAAAIVVYVALDIPGHLPTLGAMDMTLSTCLIMPNVGKSTV